MTKEILRNRVVQTSLILLLAGSALTACGDDGSSSEQEDARLTPNDAAAVNNDAEGGPDFSVDYFSNGTRQVSWDDGGYFEHESLTQWCEGGDRYTTFTSYNDANESSVGTGGIQIDLSHEDCDDGMLTPEDFALPR